MLLKTPNYKIEISRGCVLNPATSELFDHVLADEKNTQGTAVAKSLSTVIKISISKLEDYFREVR
jgi:hypothetical protein